MGTRLMFVEIISPSTVERKNFIAILTRVNAWVEWGF